MLVLIFFWSICECFETASKQKEQMWRKVSQSREKYSNQSYSDHLWLQNLMHHLVSDQECDAEKEEVTERLMVGVGAQAQVQFIPTTNQKFTGLFEGASNVIMRISSHSMPDQSQSDSVYALNNLVPKIQFKFFRNDLPPVDLTSMYSYSGQDSWNIFCNNMSTSMPIETLDLTQVFYNQKRSYCTPFIYNFGIKQLAVYDEWGQEVTNPVYPYKIVFVPNSQVKNMFRDNREELFTEQLKKIPINTNLYDVYAVQSPHNACLQKIGCIKLKSKFITSSYADKQLHFSDLSPIQDLQDNPDWRDYMTEFSFFGLFNKDKKQEGQCEAVNQISFYEL